MVLRFFRKKQPSSITPLPKKTGWWQRLKEKRAARAAQKIITQRKNLQSSIASLVDLTRQRDSMIELLSKVPLKEGEPIHAYRFRVETARGMAFNDKGVLEKQLEINNKLEQLSHSAKLKSITPNSLAKLLGEDYKINNLGWSGAPRKNLGKIGKLGYPDLGIYFVERKKN